MMSERRPIAARGSGWAQRTAAWLARSPLTPNQISCLSIVFALTGAGLLVAWSTRLGLLLAAFCIVLRLLCNLFDGMVAVEGGKGTATGALFNEIPDRVADSLLLVATGYAIALPWLGWLCALLAALTAYIRLLGASLGLPQDFRGPMAKPHRMWLLCIALAISAAAAPWQPVVLRAVLALIALGSAATCVTRSLAIARQLQSRHAT